MVFGDSATKIQNSFKKGILYLFERIIINLFIFKRTESHTNTKAFV